MLAVLGGLLALYLLGPLAAFAVRAAGGLPAAPGVGSALVVSLYTATLSCAVIALLGVPLAYLLAHGPRRLTAPATVLVALPLALPPLMSGLLLLYVLGPYTTLGGLFDGRLTDTPAGIVLAQTFVAAPFLVIAARAAFGAVDPALEEVAASLGHGRLGRFWRVAVPAALPGIAAGMLLAWLRAFGEFGATVILAYHPYSLPVFTFVQFDGSGLPGTVLPIAVSLVAALVVLTVVQLPFPRRRRRRPRRAAQRTRRSAPRGTLCFDVRARAGDFSLAAAHRCQTPRLALLGMSGAGKTLTLRSIAGLHAGAQGEVSLGGRELAQTPPERRRIGYVPQQPALLPRRTVLDQVMLGTRAGGAEAERWIGLLGLDGLQGRFPDQLSGGQQRRVALARALADGPSLLLLDEPFSGLDSILRRRLIDELRCLQDEESLCTVLVTHDPEEAAALAEEIVVLDQGRVLQAGRTGELFRCPAGAGTARLLGIPNVHEGVVAAPGLVRSRGSELRADTHRLDVGRRVVWWVRPEHVRLVADGPHQATVVRSVDLGHSIELRLLLGDGLDLLCRCSGGLAPSPGQHLAVEIDPAEVRVAEDRESAALAAERPEREIAAAL